MAALLLAACEKRAAVDLCYRSACWCQTGIEVAPSTSSSRSVARGCSCGCSGPKVGCRADAGRARYLGERRLAARGYQADGRPRGLPLARQPSSHEVSAKSAKPGKVAECGALRPFRYSRRRIRSAPYDYAGGPKPRRDSRSSCGILLAAPGAAAPFALTAALSSRQNFCVPPKTTIRRFARS